MLTICRGRLGDALYSGQETREDGRSLAGVWPQRHILLIPRHRLLGRGPRSVHDGTHWNTAAVVAMDRRALSSRGRLGNVTTLHLERPHALHHDGLSIQIKFRRSLTPNGISRHIPISYFQKRGNHHHHHYGRPGVPGYGPYAAARSSTTTSCTSYSSTSY